jgi:alpha/beta superfamily hydrolase
MEKVTIQNRQGQKVVVLIEKNNKPRGLVFIVHGLSGFKEQKHIEVFAQSFKKKGFTVVRFDTTNSFGESEGEYRKATVTSYLADLKNVLSWANSQGWYQ